MITCNYALISALTQALVRTKDTLKSFKFSVGGDPIGFSASPWVLSRGETHDGEVWEYFLVALLSCTNLHSLDIGAIGGQANDLGELIPEAIQSLQSCQKPVNLKNLCLQLHPLDRDPIRSEFVPFMTHFTECHSLENITLDLNEILWRKEGNLEQVDALLKNQRNLSSIYLSFDGLNDDIGAFEMVEGWARHHRHNLDLLSINQLWGIDENRYNELRDDLRNVGMIRVDGSKVYRLMTVRNIEHLTMRRRITDV